MVSSISNASITEVFRRCMQEAGYPVIQRGRAYKCPFHESRTKKLYLYEDKHGWHCYSGKCPFVKGGVTQMVRAFGFAETDADIAQWLSDRGLIAPPESVSSISVGFVSDFRRLYISQSDLETMTESQIKVWRQSQIDLRDEIGNFHFTNGRHHIASIRYDRRDRLKEEAVQAKLMLESIYAHCGKRCSCKCSLYQEMQQLACDEDSYAV